jgi:GTPase SAR1 family protein
MQKQKFIPTISLIGLPSAGKSTLVNSLVKKRIIKTGICRTSVTPTYVGMQYDEFSDNIIEDITITNKKHKPTSDDGYRYNMLDLPGICDAEDTEASFNTITNELVLYSDIIMWVTSVDNAFITRHEIDEYNRIRNIINAYSIANNKLYQYGIILTKLNESLDGNTTDDEFYSCDEISDDELSGDEDTNVHDSIERVATLFPDTHIIPYNAFGRIMHMDSSPKLKKLVTKMGGATSNNIKFNIGTYMNNIRGKKIELNGDIFNKYINDVYEYFNRPQPELPRYASLTEKRKYERLLANNKPLYCLTNFVFDDLFQSRNEDKYVYSDAQFERFMKRMYDVDILIDDVEDILYIDDIDGSCNNNDNDKITSIRRKIYVYICSVFRDNINVNIQNSNAQIIYRDTILNIDSIYDSYHLTLLEYTEGRTKRFWKTYMSCHYKNTVSYFVKNTDGIDANISHSYINLKHKYDILLDNNALLACSKMFHNKLTDYRNTLYENDSQNIDIHMLIRLYTNGNLVSLIQRLIFDDSIFL